MTTRLKRPSLGRKLAIAAALVLFQGYLAFHLVEGNFGVNSQEQYIEQLALLKQQSDALDRRIEVAENRNSLLLSERLDPDLLTERARHLLGWSNPNDVIIPTEQIIK
jgi:cell division protein FtsB